MTMTEPAPVAGGAGNLDCAEVRVGLTGHLYVAPVGTAAPLDLDVTPPAPWVDLGYLTEDGVSMSVDSDREDFTPWQSTSPCRSVVTSQTNTWTFTLMQRNADTLRLAFGGGTIVAGTAAGSWIYTPPPVGLSEVSFVLDVEDGPIRDRWIAYRANPALGGEVNFTKSDPTTFEVEVTLLDANPARWQLVGNDPNVTLDAEGAGMLTAAGEPLAEMGQAQTPEQTEETDTAAEGGF
jgi:hypothetical protein